MPLGSLITERVAVRQKLNTGEGLRETHGLHGKLRKLFHAAATKDHQVYLACTLRNSEKICASVRISPVPCPACVCGERHAVRWSAPPCDLTHSATDSGGHHRTTCRPKPAHRCGNWTAPASGSLRPAGLKVCKQLKPFTKVNYGPGCQQPTKEEDPR